MDNDYVLKNRNASKVSKSKLNDINKLANQAENKVYGQQVIAGPTKLIPYYTDLNTYELLCNYAHDQKMIGNQNDSISKVIQASFLQFYKELDNSNVSSAKVENKKRISFYTNRDVYEALCNFAHENKMKGNNNIDSMSKVIQACVTLFLNANKIQ